MSEEKINELEERIYALEEKLFLNTLVGTKFDNILTLSEEDRFGYTFRPTKMDGEFTIVTGDLHMDRINVEVEDGIITKVVGRG